MKYYFITYQATNKHGSVSIWNQVIKNSPMEFIKDVEREEYEGEQAYHNFVVINTCKITEEEYLTYKGCF